MAFITITENVYKKTERLDAAIKLWTESARAIEKVKKFTEDEKVTIWEKIHSSVAIIFSKIPIFRQKFLSRISRENLKLWDSIMRKNNATTRRHLKDFEFQFLVKIWCWLVLGLLPRIIEGGNSLKIFNLGLPHKGLDLLRREEL